MSNSPKVIGDATKTIQVDVRALSSVKKDLEAALNEMKNLLVSSSDTASAQRINLSILNCSQALSTVSGVIDTQVQSRSEHAFTQEIRPMSFNQLSSDLAERFSEGLQGKPELTLSFHLDRKLPSVVKADPKQLMAMIGGILETSIGYATAGKIEVEIRSVSTGAAQEKECVIQISCMEPPVGGAVDRLAVLSRALNEITLSASADNSVSGIQLAARIAHNIGGSLSVVRVADQHICVATTLTLPVVAVPKVWGQIPTLFRYFTKVSSTAAVLESVGKYHGVTPLPMRAPIPLGGVDMVFVDASIVLSGRFGEFNEYTPKDRFVLMLDHGQLRTRERLVRAGFRRFLTLPLTSTDLLCCLTSEDVPVAEIPEARIISKNGALNILVVDDIATARFRVVEHLKAMGHQVSEASDGVDLIEQVKQGKKFDFIFTDLMMTHMDGAEAARHVRHLENGGSHRATIVAMTAYTHESESNSNQSEFDALLRKPVYLDELDFLLSKAPERNTEAPKVQRTENPTQFIDLNDLSERSGGKRKLMALVLQSFMDTASTKLTELHRGREAGAEPLLLKQMHALKGLLLEVGAQEIAEKAMHFEEELRGGIIPDSSSIDEFSAAVAGACKEARMLAQQMKDT